jgi:hypothetical protein
VRWLPAEAGNARTSSAAVRIDFMVMMMLLQLAW